ncbi:hypothetical protein D9H04_07945 [Escherichia coli]|uniref:hypothetical protein n=1 Tax=Vibrio cholerae TaxID=666 RepID=UPI000FB157E3|nr:hypothetical protein [Vibrio cholerae]EEW2237435.1 hypothetical protein [Escherichia coli]EEW2469483.1 hypothetical protein [Escherichia coli]EGI4643106.1 hypothetical protein [Escherichia coli]MDY7587537.1 hypothetical protein [Vibrio cholerae]MGR07709.1 hypothetical protein [Escherichia coli]
MKSLLYGIAISVPLTALIVLFVLTGRKEVITQQKAHEIQQQIQSEEFRRDFSRAWHDFDQPISPEERNAQDSEFQQRQAEHEERIVQLKKQRGLLSQDTEAMFDQLDQDLEEMRAALRDAELARHN